MLRQQEEFQLQDYLILKLLTTICYKNNQLIESFDYIHSHLLLDWIKSDGFSEWDPFSETNTEDSSDISSYNIPQGESMNILSESNNTSSDNTIANGLLFNIFEANT